MTSHEDFEPGYDPVVSIAHEGCLLGRVGRGRGMLRIELDDDRALSFDGEGRLVAAHAGGIGYRRTLDNRLLVSRHVGTGRDRRTTRDPEPDEPLALLAGWHAEAARLSDAVAAGARVSPVRGANGAAAGWLQEDLRRAGRWTRAMLQEDTDRLRELYRPIPILPPDQYAALVLQATEGCSFNRCTFCNFYRTIPYRERSLPAFEAHVDAVLSHLGRSVEGYHRVFLGQANALLLPSPTLEAMLGAIGRRLPVRPRSIDAAERRRWRVDHDVWIDGVYAFVDSFHEPKSVEELRRLADRGLRRVYLGLETGSQRLLHVLGKPGSVSAAVAFARHLHEAELELGVIVLVGAGGKTHEAAHLEDTASALAAMGLRRGDQVYLSKLVIYEGGAYQREAERQGLTPLTPPELDRQTDRLRAGLRREIAAGVPVAPYDVDLSHSLFTTP